MRGIAKAVPCVGKSWPSRTVEASSRRMLFSTYRLAPAGDEREVLLVTEGRKRVTPIVRFQQVPFQISTNNPGFN